MGLPGLGPALSAILGAVYASWEADNAAEAVASGRDRPVACDSPPRAEAEWTQDEGPLFADETEGIAGSFSSRCQGVAAGSPGPAVARRKTSD